jgi:hypothetical protein
MRGTIEPVVFPGVTPSQLAQVACLLLAIGAYSWTRYVKQATRI